MSSAPQVLIVEDESGIADTIQYVLETDGFAPTWCATAQEAITHFTAAAPALVILDVGLPDMHGFELFRRLQALPGGPQTPMLFLTARSDEIDRVAGLELGADDYIAKPFSPRELVARVRSILRRFEKTNAAQTAPTQPPNNPNTPSSLSGSQPHLDPNTDKGTPQANTHTSENTPCASTLPFEDDSQRMIIRYFNKPLDLSRYEYRLLRLLVQRPGRVFTREELLAIVWDQGSESFDRTVDAHIKTLRAKLKTIAPDIEAIRTIRGIGYALSEEWPHPI